MKSHLSQTHPKDAANSAARSTDEDLIKRLRRLKKKAEEIHFTLVEDLNSFIQKDGTFRRLPRPSEDKGISVTTTCSALMVLAAGNQLDGIYGKSSSPRTLSVLRKICKAKWASSGLDPDNAFSTCLVLRAAGFLKQTSILKSASGFRHQKRSLAGIAKNLAKGSPRKLSVQNYPPKPAIGYWFIDGVANLEISLDESCWKRLARWASREFERQLSYVVAGNDAMMDPVSLIMAACLTERIRQACAQEVFSARITRILPSFPELHCAIHELFSLQGPSGIWSKYFPLFHFKGAGANHCFSFEFLEALLSEFGSHEFFREEYALSGLERAISWCEINRRRYRLAKKDYAGWHSGGEVTTLREGQPECWATAMVHLFLCRLCRTLSAAIKNLVLNRYTEPSAEAPRIRWEDLLDMDVRIQGKNRTVKRVLKDEVIDLLRGRTLEEGLIKTRRSGLLFGPPGTSKTTLVKLLAKELGWRLVEITPSHFLNMGLEKIYIRADEIFEDLMDLYGAVVLFDEMDALVQSRDEQGATHLDVTQQFLTTSMLPKLAKLHDRAKVVFFMATNHRRMFDPAILRPGRFDILLCIPPPTWKRKLTAIESIMGLDSKKENINKIIERLRTWTQRDRKRCGLLDRFTFDEMRTFFREQVWSKKNFSFTSNLGVGRKDHFLKSVDDWGKKFITLKEEDLHKTTPKSTYEEYLGDRSSSHLQ